MATKKETVSAMPTTPEELQSIIAAAVAQAKRQEDEPVNEPANVKSRMDEMVEITLFKDGRDYSDDVFVAVNDKRYQIKRGVPVRVPRRVAMVIERSLGAVVYANERADEAKKGLDGF